jgi:hypothetical protein
MFEMLGAGELGLGLTYRALPTATYIATIIVFTFGAVGVVLALRRGLDNCTMHEECAFGSAFHRDADRRRTDGCDGNVAVRI